MGIAVYPAPPTSRMLRTFLGRTIQKNSATPKTIITDKDKRFRCPGFRKWARRRSIDQRFGAVGKHGSAIIERFIRTFKDEGTRRIVVPYRRDRMRREASLFLDWYNGHRPHTTLSGATPDEVYFGRARKAAKFEPRPRWPHRKPTMRGEPVDRLALQCFLRSRRHLPIVSVKLAA